MPYCDHHGWGWEPGKGPSPCVGETLSFWLALSLLFCSIKTEQGSMLHTVQFPAGSGAAAKVHGAQITLSIAQSILALTGGMLSARPKGMLCGALVLHSLGWTLAWLASAVALQKNPRFARCSFWWWLGAAASNSVVLSSLHNASEHEGHDLPAEIAALSWLSFFGNALLVLLQITKPELDDTDTVYVRMLGDDRLEPVPASGWQAFWNGGDTSDVTTRPGEAGREDSQSCSGCLLRWVGRLFCCRWGGGGDDVVGTDGVAALGGGGAWPIVREAGAPGSNLNESLLGTIGVGGSVSGRDVSSPFKPKERWRGYRRASDRSSDGGTGRACFQRMGGFISSIFCRGGRKAATEEEDGNERLSRHEDSIRRNVGGTTLAVGVGTATRLPRGVREQSSFTSAPYAAPLCTPRAPPQAAAPVFGVSVTRWRLVDADGIPSAHGAPTDVVWNDRSTERSDNESRSSARTATLSGSEVATVSSVVVPSDAGPSAMDELEDNYPSMTSYLTVQFELAVRASGRGEMDWWGRGGGTESSMSTSTFAAGSAATAAGDWRVWRSAADMLALYDALALRFGQEFCGRVARPQFNTAVTNVVSAADHKKGGNKALYSSGGSLPQPTTPHRVDILRDARRAGAFLRSLLGLRQFLSTAVMDFLARPSLEAQALSPEGNKGSNDDATCGNEDRQSWDSSDAGSVTDESGDEGPPRAGYGGASRRSLSAGKVGTGVSADPSAAGEALAVAALATDYGAWLKRLAVKLRRSTPAGENFVRLRRIGPAVTGEQVVRWLMTSSGECKGDRASAVRLGQDMVSHGLLSPLCAGYGTPNKNPFASATEARVQRDLLHSFDDAVGWLFAYAGDALRDPFAAPPPTKVVVMTGTHLNVSISDWIETSDDQGAHVSFVVKTQVQATQESWDAPRRYRDFTQLRKRLLRLGVDIPTLAATREGARSTGAEPLSVDLPKKTWRANKFDKDHLAARRAALETYLQAAVEAALATPHFAGHLVMRFLDPDESNLRFLCGQNPFGPLPPRRRRTEGRGGRGGGGGEGSSGSASRGASVGGGIVGETGDLAQETGGGRLIDSVDQAEAEDFDTLTDSLGGFG